MATGIQERITDSRKRLDSLGLPVIERPEGLFRAGADMPLSRYFDHTLLKPDAGLESFDTLCREARALSTASVCVPPNRVARCVELLSDTDVDVATVIGFPLGYAEADAKVRETELARSHGAVEFDTVIPIGLIKDTDYAAVFEDLSAVVGAAKPYPVKVIVETALLTEDETIAAGVISVRAGAAFLKTSTGFASAGATAEGVELLRAVAGEEVGVKAAGGIRTTAFALELIRRGADRLGASATAAILEESEA